jgi:hypothetical protein
MAKITKTNGNGGSKRTSVTNIDGVTCRYMLRMSPEDRKALELVSKAHGLRIGQTLRALVAEAKRLVEDGRMLDNVRGPK